MFHNVKNKTMKLKSLIALLITLSLTGIGVTQSLAQQGLGIAAIVNDEMISMYDLNTRIDSVIAFAGFSNTPENRQRVAPQVLASLINERVKLQEAARMGFTASPGRIKKSKADLERQNRMKPGQLKEFIARNNLQESSIEEQIKANIVWSRMIGSRYSRDVKITDEEINEVIEKQEKNKGQPEDLVFEIFLPIKQKQNEADVIRLAERLVQQIRKGANFSAIAQNFSQSSSASSGGSLGWTLRKELRPDLKSIVATMQPGQLVGPVRTNEGILIVLLRDTRKSRGLDGPPAGPEKIKLFQLHLALPKAASQDTVNQLLNRARTETRNINGCESMGALAKKIGSPLSGLLGTFEISKISPKMQTLVKNIPAKQPSEPLLISDGVIVLMVCERNAPKAKVRTLEEKRDIVRNQLINQRLGLAAKRYLRDLKRAAFIDIRLGRQ